MCPNRPGLRGETVRQRPERVVPEYLGIPRDVYLLHHFVTLTADVMFVIGLAFFNTLGRDIRFGTAEHVPYRTAKQLAKSLLKVVQLMHLVVLLCVMFLWMGNSRKLNLRLN